MNDDETLKTAETPQETPETPPQETADPYATDDLLNQMAAIMDELEATAPDLPAKFAEFCANDLPPEVTQQLGQENLTNLALYFADAWQRFAEGFQGKMREYDDLQNQVNYRNTAREFATANPDVDKNALVDFYENDLTGRQKAELEKLPANEQLNALYALYQQANGGANSAAATAAPAAEPEPELPTNVRAEPQRATPNVKRGSNNYETRF